MSGELTRRDKEKRGYQLVMVGGGAGMVTVVGAVLAIVGVIGWGLPFVALVVAVICFVMFRRLVGPS
jgi:hypothetical protein